MRSGKGISTVPRDPAPRAASVGPGPTPPAVVNILLKPFVPPSNCAPWSSSSLQTSSKHFRSNPFDDTGSISLPGEILACLPGISPQLFAKCRLVSQLAKTLQESRTVAGLVKESIHAMANDLRNLSRIAGYHGLGCGHVFEQFERGVVEVLQHRIGRQCNINGCQIISYFFVGNDSCKRNGLFQTSLARPFFQAALQRAVPYQEQAGRRFQPVEVRKHGEKEISAVPGLETADKPQHELLLFFVVYRDGVTRREPLCIHGVGQNTNAFRGNAAFLY